MALPWERNVLELADVDGSISGRHHFYRWDAKINTFDAEKPTPIDEWTFEGGPREFR